MNQAEQSAPMVYIPQVDNYNAIEAFVRRVYNPNGDPMKDRNISIQPYIYPTSFAAALLTNGASAQKIVSVASNADFVITTAYYKCTASNAAVNSPLFRVLLSDTGSQEQLSAEQVELSTMFGSPGNAQFSWPYPRIISGRSSLSVAIQNYSSGVDYDTLDLSFVGVLVRGF